MPRLHEIVTYDGGVASVFFNSFLELVMVLLLLRYTFIHPSTDKPLQVQQNDTYQNYTYILFKNFLLTSLGRTSIERTTVIISLFLIQGCRYQVLPKQIVEISESLCIQLCYLGSWTPVQWKEFFTGIRDENSDTSGYEVCH